MSTEAWARFEHDPRAPQTAALRASDHDRDTALEMLGDAYADGRLDRQEFDARSAAVAEVKLVGGLLPHLEDLLPASTGHPLAPDGAGALPVRDRAMTQWGLERRKALKVFVVVSMLCWVIWAITIGPIGFPWPVFPMVATGAKLVRTIVQKDDIVEGHEKAIVKQERKHLTKERRELGSAQESAGPADDEPV